MDKDSFLTLFPLSGLWGERLFNNFDIHKTGDIDLPAFLAGIGKCCKSDLGTRLRVFFELYDSQSKGFITKEEFTKMVI